MRRLPAILAIAAALFFYSLTIWREGVDAGAVMMQCVDFHSVLGADEAEKSQACQEAARRQQSDPLYLLFKR